MVDDALLKRWESAADRITWRQPWHAVYEPGGRGGRWFPGATLNAAENCVDRHLPTLAQKVALHWEGEPGDRRAITYRELHREVCAFADALRALGVGPGDRVAIYMGLLPETVVAMLACARLGAVHALLASAMPADALADRLADFEPKVLVTQDGAWRHGMILPLKARADEAIPAASGVEHTVVVRRTGIDVAWYEGDRWYDELLARPRPGMGASTEPPQPVAADHPLLAVYIATRRGRPTGIVYGTGGFLTYAASIHADGLTAGPDDVLWCAVEIAWVVGQSHGVYGALAGGGTSVIYEGMLDTPTHGRSWDVIERHRVNTFVTTPSVVRNLRRWVDSPPREGQLDSLRHAFTGGESAEPELHEWLRKWIGPTGGIVADGWGQTELGGIVVLSNTPHGADGLPRAGLDVVDANGRSVPTGVEGEVVVREPWPGTYVGVQNDDPEEAARHWERYPGAYATGDRAVLEPGGSIAFLGRIDPVVTVSGQLVSLTEVREALLEHPFVREAEIIDRMDRQTGQSLAAFVVFGDSLRGSEELARALRDHVRERLGGLAQPRTIAFVDAFPAELGHATLRKALGLLCAAAGVDEFYFFVSTDELRTAAGTVGVPGTQ
jgi:acetyl-CoA synthetase